MDTGVVNEGCQVESFPSEHMGDPGNLMFRMESLNRCQLKDQDIGTAEHHEDL